MNHEPMRQELIQRYGLPKWLSVLITGQTQEQMEERAKMLRDLIQPADAQLDQPLADQHQGDVALDFEE